MVYRVLQQGLLQTSVILPTPHHHPNMKRPSNSLFFSLFLYSKKSVITVRHHSKRVGAKDITDALGLYIDRNITSDSQMILDWLMPNAKGQKQCRGEEPEDPKNHPPGFSLNHLLHMEQPHHLCDLKNSASHFTFL